MEQAHELEPHERAPAPRAPQAQLALRLGRDVQYALGGQEQDILGGLVADAHGELGPREAGLEFTLSKSSAGLLPWLLLLLLLFPAEVEHETAAPEVHAQQPPQPHDGAGLAHEHAEGLQLARKVERERGARRGQGLGVEDEGRLRREGARNRDQPRGAALQGRLDEGGEDRGGETRRVAHDLEDRVDARGRRHASLQVC